MRPALLAGVVFAGIAGIAACDAGGAQVISDDQCFTWVDTCGGCAWVCSHQDDVLPGNDCDIDCTDAGTEAPDPCVPTGASSCDWETDPVPG